MLRTSRYQPVATTHLVPEPPIRDIPHKITFLIDEPTEKQLLFSSLRLGSAIRSDPLGRMFVTNNDSRSETHTGIRCSFRILLSTVWCLLSLGAPVPAQISIEDSEIPIEESEERESKESVESSDLLAFRRRGRQLSPRPIAVWATISRIQQSLNRLAPPRSGHSLPNGLSAPMTC